VKRADNAEIDEIAFIEPGEEAAHGDGTGVGF
jgi:hypothetical protein